MTNCKVLNQQSSWTTATLTPAHNHSRPCNSRICTALQVLSEQKIGVVAHFYMDPQVQGVLTSAGQRWPHIHISDSLVMADSAVRMAEAGCQSVAVLGVDFMSENVRAILDEAGHQDVKVRWRPTAIDMSLAFIVRACVVGKCDGFFFHFVRSQHLVIILSCKGCAADIIEHTWVCKDMRLKASLCGMTLQNRICISCRGYASRMTGIGVTEKCRITPVLQA